MKWKLKAEPKFAEVDKRKLLQQRCIDGQSVVSETLSHSLNFESLRNTGFEGYVLPGKTVNCKYVEEGICPEPNGSQALLWLRKKWFACSWSSQLWPPVEPGSQSIWEPDADERGTITTGPLNWHSK